MNQARKGKTAVVNFGGICELVLETEDVGRLVSFYRELGLELLLEEDDKVWLAVGDNCRLGIWPPGEQEFDDRGGRHVHFALSVDRNDLEALTSRLRERGVEVQGPVEHDGGDHSVYFSDPAGNRVELWNFFRDGDGAEDGVMALAEDGNGA
ncbi:MAG TPA: VOC family protein [Solirubrobacterales bacterium]|nr:VOC family protein [Solirubrobacterales bacterium]